MTITKRMGSMLLVAAVSAVCFIQTAVAYEFVKTDDVEYGKGAMTAGDKSLVMNTFLPTGAEALTDKPAVILLHVGNFSNGHKDRSFITSTGEYLAALGIPAFAINHRMAADQSAIAKELAAVVDAKAAIRWVRANAATYGIDKDRIVVMGNLAGGWLATALAVYDETAWTNDANDGGAARAENNPTEASKPNLAVVMPGWPYEFATTDISAEFSSDDPHQYLLYGANTSGFFPNLGDDHAAACSTASAPYSYELIPAVDYAVWGGANTTVNTSLVHKMAEIFTEWESPLASAITDINGAAGTLPVLPNPVSALRIAQLNGVAVYSLSGTPVSLQNVQGMGTYLIRQEGTNAFRKVIISK